MTTPKCNEDEDPLLWENELEMAMKLKIYTLHLNILSSRKAI